MTEMSNSVEKKASDVVGNNCIKEKIGRLYFQGWSEESAGRSAWIPP